MRADYFLAHRPQVISCWMHPNHGMQLKAQALDRIEIVNTELGTVLRCEACRAETAIVIRGFTAIVHRPDCNVMVDDEQPVKARMIPRDWLQSRQFAEVVL